MPIESPAPVGCFTIPFPRLFISVSNATGAGWAFVIAILAALIRKNNNHLYILYFALSTQTSSIQWLLRNTPRPLERGAGVRVFYLAFLTYILPCIFFIITSGPPPPMVPYTQSSMVMRCMLFSLVTLALGCVF